MAIKNICGAGKMDSYRKKGNIYDMVWILAAAKTWNMLPDGYQPNWLPRCMTLCNHNG
jgi:hypothetical protein